MSKPWLVPLACVVIAASVAACGEDDDDGGDLVSQPEPASPIEDQVATVNEAIASQECDQFASLNFTFLRAGPDGELPEPGAAAQSKPECDFLEQNPLAQLDGVEFTESEEFGAAAVSEGQLPEPIQGYDTVDLIWLVDWDGEYRNVFYFPADPQLGEEPAEGADPAASVEALIEAARTGECTRPEEFIEPTGPLASSRGGAKEGCEAVAGGTIFAPAVKGSPDAAPEEMGVTRDYAFFGVPTKDAYFAVVLGTPPTDPGQPPQDEFRVLDVLPLTEVELQPPPEEETGAGSDSN